MWLVNFIEYCMLGGNNWSIYMNLDIFVSQMHIIKLKRPSSLSNIKLCHDNTVLTQWGLKTPRHSFKNVTFQRDLNSHNHDTWAYLGETALFTFSPLRRPHFPWKLRLCLSHTLAIIVSNSLTQFDSDCMVRGLFPFEWQHKNQVASIGRNLVASAINVNCQHQRVRIHFWYNSEHSIPLKKGNK